MKRILTFLWLICASQLAQAQCSPDVPIIQIDLSANPDTVWNLSQANAPDRLGQCCGVPANQECIQFQVTVNDNVAGLFFDYDGAPSYGSLSWSIDCGPAHNLRDTICFVPSGPFTITFCKPGADNGNYTLISVAKPTFPGDQTVPRNCAMPLPLLGLDADSPSWESVYPGAPGQYNNLLSCTDCMEPIFTPTANAPSEIRYRICGTAIMEQCFTDAHICDTMSIFIEDPLALSVSPAQPAFCQGGSITLTAQASGGDGNYTYIWTNGMGQVVGAGPSFVASAAGAVSCEVRDGNYLPGYCDDFIQTLTVVQTTPPSVFAGVDQVMCATSPNAGLGATVQNSPGGVWSGGSGTFQQGSGSAVNTYIPSASEINAGSVTLTYSTTGVAGGCMNTSDQVTLMFVDTIETNLADVELLCKNGSINVSPSVTGGMAPLTYSWSNGATTLANTLVEGSFSLTITDAIGCQTVQSVDVSSPALLTFQNLIIDCPTPGDNEANVSLTPNGGTAAYQVSFDGGNTFLPAGQFSADLTVNAPYNIVIRDANNCLSAASPFEIDGNVEIDAVSFDKCYEAGQATELVNVTVSGGAAGYSISYDNGITFQPVGQTSFNLPIGSIYSIIARDAGGCLSEVSIAELPEIFGQDINIDSDFNGMAISCNGMSNGAASVNITGGSAPYSVLWNTGQTTNSISGLSAGVYSVVVEDANGCEINASIEIEEPEELAVPLLSPNDFNGHQISCHGMSTGAIQTQVIGGVGPFTYSWSNGATTPNLSGLTAGTYVLTLTDANGCMTSASMQISEPDALTAMVISPNNFNGNQIRCHGMSDGAIETQINGGVEPYTFSWDNGSNEQNLSGLMAGIYTLTATDLNGCIVTGSIVMTEPAELSADVVASEVSCNSGANGSINVTPAGGVLPYSFSWNNGAVSEDLAGISQGTYSMVLTDANNCILDIEQMIAEPTSVALAIQTTNVTCQGFTDGSVDLSANGGTPPYVYTWSNGSSSEDISYLPVGSYSVNVLDANGCMGTLQAYVAEPDALGIQEVITKPSCYSYENGALDVSVYGGTTPFQFSWSNGSTSEDLSSIGADTYELIVTDANGCVLSQAFIVDQPDELSLEMSSPVNFHEHNISLFGGNDGSITSTVVGGTEPYNYDWSVGGGMTSLENLSAGVYALMVTDANGCKIADTINLTQPMNLELPTIFTPNEDGDNDWFDIHGIEAYPDNNLVIVNRWGNVVFEEDNYHNTWKGTHLNGEELPDGVYFVILKINDSEIEKNTYVHIKRY